jgi:SAM-dependent methyltransferase
MNYRIAADSILRIHDGAGWILTNPRARHHFELDRVGLEAIVQSAEPRDDSAWAATLKEASGWDRSHFSNADGLMADPTGFGPRKGEALHGRQLFEALRHARLMETSDRADYLAFLGPQTSILDQEHLGTFHQAVGRFQLRDLRRKDRWRWWHDQKFSPDGRELAPGFYRWIQGHFFEKYFGAQNLQAARALDFGCGNGFYSARFSALGAKTVIGIDTSADLLEIARGNYPDIDFRLSSEQAIDETLGSLSTGSFDVIYMSDVLLFFFYDPKTQHRNDAALARLFAHFRRLLDRNGVLYLMEPNATFWLAPWLGAPPCPWTVVTEYRNHLYSVAPTVDEVVTVLGASGFAVTTFRHPEIQEQDGSIDPLAYSYARNFPLWDFYGCRPLAA